MQTEVKEVRGKKHDMTREENSGRTMDCKEGKRKKKSTGKGCSMVKEKAEVNGQ